MSANQCFCVIGMLHSGIVHLEHWFVTMCTVLMSSIGGAGASFLMKPLSTFVSVRGTVFEKKKITGHNSSFWRADNTCFRSFLVPLEDCFLNCSTSTFEILLSTPLVTLEKQHAFWRSDANCFTYGNAFSVGWPGSSISSTDSH